MLRGPTSIAAINRQFLTSLFFLFYFYVSVSDKGESTISSVVLTLWKTFTTAVKSGNLKKKKKQLGKFLLKDIVIILSTIAFCAAELLLGFLTKAKKKKRRQTL